MPLFIMLGILGIGLVLLGLTFPAKAKLEAAQTKAEELQNGDGNKNWPLDLNFRCHREAFEVTLQLQPITKHTV